MVKGRKLDKEIIISVENVSYTYEDGTEALKNLSLQIRKGEKLAVMGANGSGKSTLFLTLNGVRKPASGRIVYNGQPVEYTKKGLLDLRKKVGIVFQDPDNQLFSASVTQEISFGILNLGISKEEARKRVDKIIAELNIFPYKDKPTHLLSGGQKKIVSIADILVMEPEVIIFDEPAAALDPKHALLIDNIIDELSRKGITVVLSTHDVNRAYQWADRIIMLDHGEVAGEGPPEKIFRNKELLNQTNMEEPFMIKLFENLRNMGLIGENEKIPPKSLDELKKYIKTE
ncbi:MAG: energy-coupling factor ABC transporter ATP-binding protein [Anaerovoracaceae bacterium]|jgi:cobalt/nickel transport system ATP-binding protein